MHDSPPIGSRSRDESYLNYDLSNAIYGSLPSASQDFSPRRSCATLSRKKASRRPRSGDSTPPRSISLSPSACWLPLSKKQNVAQYDQRLDLHQSTCLNLNLASQENTETDLWILPDFDDWAYDTPSTQGSASSSKQPGSEWAPYLRRAANSNLERLRARLEGDGWAFVGGKYEEDKQVLQEEARLSEESVDEEFDVVVLPTLRVS